MQSSTDPSPCHGSPVGGQLHGSIGRGSIAGSIDSSLSLPRVCRICLLEEGDERDCSSDADPLIEPCACKGSGRWVHRMCLRTWRKTGRNGTASVVCPVCGSEYDRDALATVSCSSLGSHSTHDQQQQQQPASAAGRAAAMALLTLQQRLATQQHSGAGLALELGTAAPAAAARAAHVPPSPSWVQSTFGPLGILLVIALVVGWVRGEHNIVVWVRGSFLAVVATCCSPIAILHVALPAAIHVAASSLGGRPGDYSLVEYPLTATAVMLIVAVVAAIIFLPEVAGETQALAFRALASGISFPLTCFNHYRIVKQRRDEWVEQQHAAQLRALEEQFGSTADEREQLILWQQRIERLSEQHDQQQQRQHDQQQQQQQQHDQQQQQQQVLAGAAGGAQPGQGRVSAELPGMQQGALAGAEAAAARAVPSERRTEATLPSFDAWQRGSGGGGGGGGAPTQGALGPRAAQEVAAPVHEAGRDQGQVSGLGSGEARPGQAADMQGPLWAAGRGDAAAPWPPPLPLPPGAQLTGQSGAASLEQGRRMLAQLRRHLHPRQQPAVLLGQHQAVPLGQQQQQQRRDAASDAQASGGSEAEAAALESRPLLAT